MRGEKGGTGGARERPQNDRRDAKGSTLDGGTAKATAADLQREKTPRNGRAGLDHWAVFPAQNVVFVNPPKDSPEFDHTGTRVSERVPTLNNMICASSIF